MTQKTDQCLGEWIDREALAEAMIPLVGQLYRNNNVVTSIYGRGLINRSVIAILKAHRFARHRIGDDSELSVRDTYPILKIMSEMDLGSASVDLGKMAVKFNTQANGRSLEQFVRDELASVAGKRDSNLHQGTDVVLYGFGRIGRLLARILVEKTGAGDGLRLRAIVVRKGAENDLSKRASLLRRDSVHGPFDGTIVIDEENNTMTVNGSLIQVIYSNDPKTVDYTQYGIKDALLVDNTGRWRDAEGLGQHLTCPGIARVVLTAPGKGEIKNVVHGINHNDITADDKIISAASCTTNAIVPVLKAINDKFGIVNGHVETVHSYTNDQNLIDNFHTGSRRGRSAPLNMVITETGAATAAAKALPILKGKLTGNAIRVPTPNVSMAILNLNLEKNTDREEVNEYLRQMAMHSDLQKQIDYVCSQEVVSTDFVGSRHAGVVDAEATICTDNRVILYVWYDNEYGYSCQVVRVMEDIAGVNPPAFPQ